jgi:hypothetical protein
LISLIKIFLIKGLTSCPNVLYYVYRVEKQEQDSMNYTVLQLNVSEDVYAAVNKMGNNAAAGVYPVWEAKMETMFYGGLGFCSWMSEYYDAVCDIEADSLSQVFDIGNIGPESKISRKKRMHSISVGDIIRCNKTGTFHMVDSCGFTQLMSFTNPAYQLIS